MGPAQVALIFAPTDARCVAGPAGRSQPPHLAAPEGRGAAGAAVVATGSAPGARAFARARAARRARRRARATAGRAAVPAHRRAAPRGRRDCARPGPRAAHAPPAAGRRGQRQDGGGRAGGLHRHRRRLAMRTDGAHRNPGRAALRQAGRLARAAAAGARPARGLAHRQPEEEGARRDAGRHRKRRGGAGGGHARRHPGAGEVSEAGPGDHRRAASFWGGAAAGVAAEVDRCGWRTSSPPAGEGRGEGKASLASGQPLTPALSPEGRGRQMATEPHLLMMSATPIPRTLAMSYYADLDVSTLDELPPGRTPVVTKLLAEHRRGEVIERIRGQIAEGRQVYWVCPLIEESEALDLRNATETHAELSEALPGQMIGLLHSRMPVAEKKAVMALFTSGAMPVLVSTTVIEVGVDVPNASLMVIEHAERFGLSQLHQLRGRVGRGAAASACVLLYSAPDGGRLGETARARLKAMAETSDGFEIARRDLEIRGPGEFLGARQSGAALLRFADLAEDSTLLQWARGAAPRMLDQHAEMARRHVDRWLGTKSDYLKA
nr:helicase-related protein [Ottowia beijingensis]